MKRLFALSILSLAAASACAQSGSSLNLYGLVDAGYFRVTEIKGVTDNRIASGIMEGSRWGVRGNEDIGGGYRGLFTLESRLESNNGTLTNRPASGTQLPDRLSTATLLGLPASRQATVTTVANALASQVVGVNLNGGIFDRQAFVGLVTPVGAVLIGRQYTPGYETAATFDITETQSSLAAGQIASLPAAFDIRINNTVQYRIQTGGFTAGLSYAPGNSGNINANRFLGGMAMYKSSGFSAGLGYNTKKNENSLKSLTSTVAGTSFGFGGNKISLLYAQLKDENPSGLSGSTGVGAIVAAGALAQGATQAQASALGAAIEGAFVNGLKQDARLMQIGYRLTAGPSTFYVAYNRLDDKRPADADTDSYGFIYSYAVTKRTDLNLVVVRFNNKNLGQAAPGGNGFLGGVTTSAGKDSSNYAFGVRHRF